MKGACKKCSAAPGESSAHFLGWGDGGDSVRGTKMAEAGGAFLALKLVASASRKSAVMIGYLTPVTSDEFSDDVCCL